MFTNSPMVHSTDHLKCSHHFCMDMVHNNLDIVYECMMVVGVVAADVDDHHNSMDNMDCTNTDRNGLVVRLMVGLLPVFSLLAPDDKQITAETHGCVADDFYSMPILTVAHYAIQPFDLLHCYLVSIHLNCYLIQMNSSMDQMDWNHVKKRQQTFRFVALLLVQSATVLFVQIMAMQSNISIDIIQLRQLSAKIYNYFSLNFI